MANIKKGKDPAVADAKSIETTTKYRLVSLVKKVVISKIFFKKACYYYKQMFLKS